MAWTYTQLKAAIATLSPTPVGPAAIAAVLNAQTVTLAAQPITWGPVKLLARTSATGDWSRIVARSRMTPALPPASTLDAAILAAINATEGMDNDVIDPGNAAAWATFQGGMAALEATGDIAAATVAAILALTGPTVPMWQPLICSGDVQTAEAQTP